MLNANIIVDPRMAGLLRCNNCSMNFNSQHLLTKHKLKFCVGSTGDPDDLQLKRGFRSTSPRVIVSPEDRPLTDSALLLNKKLYQLRKLKDQRSRSRDLHDLEERMLLDQLNDGEGSKSPMKQRNRMPLSKHRDVRDLQLEVGC
ncbi:uncharacterized protein LOC128555984 [Mercenaria mercenaria]|uniref:uncharacterized protein LOC128555984 n=1 Tax=Mercenaria mercenaria TaxID=6596 RepID=UPI00234FB580|nr:uncharacterized protein LOC128555984 [Mercenaria mercenaria]